MQKIPFIDLFKSALHVSGHKLAHPQGHFLTVYTELRNFLHLVGCLHRFLTMHGLTKIKKKIFIFGFKSQF